LFISFSRIFHWDGHVTIDNYWEILYREEIWCGFYFCYLRNDIEIAKIELWQMLHVWCVSYQLSGRYWHTVFENALFRLPGMEIARLNVGVTVYRECLLLLGTWLYLWYIQRSVFGQFSTRFIRLMLVCYKFHFTISPKW
jgi:hypothetical protein